MNYVNISQIQQFTPQQFVKHCSELTAMPALIIYFIASMLVFLGVGLALVNNKEKFLKIWAITFVFNLVIMFGIIFSPNVIQAIISFFTRLFS